MDIHQPATIDIMVSLAGPCDAKLSGAVADKDPVTRWEPGAPTW